MRSIHGFMPTPSALTLRRPAAYAEWERRSAPCQYALNPYANGMCRLQPLKQDVKPVQHFASPG
eukprot:136713-Amphidinium_carterae.1